MTNKTPEEVIKAQILSMDKAPLKGAMGAIEWGWVVRWRAPNGTEHATEIMKEKPTNKEIDDAVRADLKYIMSQVGREVTL